MPDQLLNLLKLFLLLLLYLFFLRVLRAVWAEVNPPKVAEAPTKANIWNPTVLGILTVICAVVLFCGSVITLIPGSFMVSRLGRETATIFITLLSISLALPTLIWGAH
jgi:hypothetical protein